MVATGPWVLTILSLATISWATRGDLDLETLAAFRTIIIYSFATSLIVTAPITIITTRMTGDLLHRGQTDQLLQCFVASLIITSTLVATALAICAATGLATPSAIATVICSSIISLVWIALAFSTALRDYRGILGAFCTGLAVATLGAILAAQDDSDFIGISAAFASGLFVIVLFLVYRIVDECRSPITNIGDSLRAFAAFGRKNILIALGATFVTAGVWVDKWIIWSGPDGERARSGLVHAPTYDGAMFVAYLSIVPCLILFVSILESSFTRSYRHYFQSISAHATLKTIERNATGLAAQTFDILKRTGRAQIIICMIFVMAAPNIVDFAGLRFEDTGLLRVGAIGAGFHFLFLACLALLLFFERNEEFCQLGACHFILNSTFTAATLLMGTQYYGLGYLAAAVTSSLIAFAAVERSVRQLTYFTFSRALGGHRT